MVVNHDFDRASSMKVHKGFKSVYYLDQLYLEVLSYFVSLVIFHNSQKHKFSISHAIKLISSLLI